MKSMQTGKNPVWLLCKVSLCWVSSACFCRRKRTCFWSFTLVFDWQHVNSFTISLSLMLQIMGKKMRGYSVKFAAFFLVSRTWQIDRNARIFDVLTVLTVLTSSILLFAAGLDRLDWISRCAAWPRPVSTPDRVQSSHLRPQKICQNPPESSNSVEIRKISVTQLTDQRKFILPTLENHISWFLLPVLRWHPSTRAVTECSTHT